MVTCERDAGSLALARDTWAAAGVTHKARADATDGADACPCVRACVCADVARHVAQVEARLGPALATLDALLAEQEASGGAPRFDLCFIDADKRAYGDYYDRAMKLVRSRC